MAGTGESETVRTGVLVVGGGIAGSLAAIEAARTGAPTAMVLKGGPGRGVRGNTAVAGGGFAAALGHTDPGDSPDAHLRDTVLGGEFLNDQHLARIMADEAPERIRYLEALGVPFEHDAGGYRQRQAPGHSHPRSVVVARGGMPELGRTLRRRVQEAGVTVHRGLTVTDVLLADGAAAGAACLAEDGQQIDIAAAAVILATGGAGALYPVTSNPASMTGDGYACGYRAGARLRDMEFSQFTPAGLVHPESLRGWSVSHELLAHPQARLLDRQGNPVCPPGDMVLRDLGFRLDLIRTIHRALRAGQGLGHGGLGLDLRAIPVEEFDGLAPGLRERLLAEGIDPARELVEVAPEAHFFVGGLQVNEHGETSVPGLFAAGETAGGCHGANRLTHNAFPEMIVFAPRAGKAAGQRARRVANARLPRPEPVPVTDLTATPELRRELQTLMLGAAGPMRSADALAAALARLLDLRAAGCERKSGACEVLESHALSNLFDVAELSMRSALAREESRGAHFREDRPVRDDRRWLLNLVVKRGAAGPVVSEAPVDLPYLAPGSA